MSALGQKRTFFEVCAMSALPPKADIVEQGRDVRFVPKADKVHRSNRNVIPALTSTVSGTKTRANSSSRLVIGAMFGYDPCGLTHGA
jgi:hypothetical protein